MYNGRPILLLGCCSSWWNSLDYIYFSAILVPSLHFPWRGLSWVESSWVRQGKTGRHHIKHTSSLSLLKYPSVIHVHGWWTPMRSLKKGLNGWKAENKKKTKGFNYWYDKGLHSKLLLFSHHDAKLGCFFDALFFCKLHNIRIVSSVIWAATRGRERANEDNGQEKSWELRV